LCSATSAAGPGGSWKSKPRSITDNDGRKGRPSRWLLDLSYATGTTSTRHLGGTSICS
jgi:hypothetical protein